jgi:hypothetical protein
VAAGISAFGSCAPDIPGRARKQLEAHASELPHNPSDAEIFALGQKAVTNFFHAHPGLCVDKNLSHSGTVVQEELEAVFAIIGQVGDRRTPDGDDFALGCGKGIQSVAPVGCHLGASID